MRSPFAEPGDAGKSVVGGLGPDKRLRCFAGDREIVINGAFQRGHAAMRAPFDLFAIELRKPAFDEIHPGGARGGEVHIKPWALRQPALNERRLVRAVVVEDEMHLQARGDRGFDPVQEPTEFGTGMSAKALADDGSRLGIQGRKQGRGPVPGVVVGAPFDLTGSHRQERGGPVQRLNLALLVGAQHQGAIGRMQIEADEIANLLDEEPVLRERERLRAMRL